MVVPSGSENSGAIQLPEEGAVTCCIENSWEVKTAKDFFSFDILHILISGSLENLIILMLQERGIR